MSPQPTGLTSRTEATASVIIPAYNEEATIKRTLKTVLADAAPGEFDVIVVCNGCRDRTAQVAKGFGNRVRVIELELASKTNALNIGIELAHAFPTVFLDADVQLSTFSLRQLVTGLEESGKCLAAGLMNIDQAGCDRWVRGFHRVWRLQPYFDRGKVGGVFALSREGCRRIGRFPSVTADDTFVRRSFPPTEYAFVDDCHFTAKAPRTLGSLVRVRARVRRGNIELNKMAVSSAGRGKGSRNLFLRRILGQPSVWLSVPTYFGVIFSAEFLARRAISRKENGWSQDTTTRSAIELGSEIEA